MNGYAITYQDLRTELEAIRNQIQSLERMAEAFRNRIGRDGVRSDDAQCILGRYEVCIRELKMLLRRDFDAENEYK